MATFGFWNINSPSDLSDQGRLAGFASDFAVEYSLDILFLIECPIPYSTLMAALKGRGPDYYPIDSSERFKVIARFDPKFMKRLEPVPGDRFNIWHLALPLQEDVILVLVHGLDKWNNSSDKQELLMQQLLTSLEYFETEIGHDRSIVLGDFNANPFESPIASAAIGMHAVLSRDIAQSKPRGMLNKSYSYFYNPMWNLYGDEPRHSAPATYYYRGSDPYELYWHMLDQVLLRPSLLNGFEFSSLEIVTTLQGSKLTGKSGHPDRLRYSDHLPVVFAVDLTNNDGA